MDAKYYSSRENEACNEATIKQSLLRHSYRNKEASSASSISPSMSVSVGENSVFSQFSAFCQVNEIDRLVSDQGLITPKVQPNTSRRRIRDKYYYKGIIRLKTKDIFDEIKKLQSEFNFLSAEQHIYIHYKKKAESRAIDLENLHKILTEYNLLDDLLRRDIQLDETKRELQELKADNIKENAKLEKQLVVAKQKEMKIKEIETNISQENDVSEILTRTLNSEICEKLKKLQRMDYRLQILRTEQEGDLMKLEKERDNLENQCSQIELLDEELKLIKKLWSSERKRDEFHSGNNFISSQKEYEYLQNYENECNLLLKGLIQERQNVQSKIQNTMEELKKFESEIYNPHSDRSATFSKLNNREKTIDEFLSHYNDEQHELLTKRQQQENNIVQLLVDNSNKINSFISYLHDEHYENDITIEKMKMEYVRSFKEWEECDHTESNFLKQKSQLMTIENKISAVSNIEEANINSEVKETKLLKELNEVKEQKRAWVCILSDLKKRHDSLQYNLNDNETYKMLLKLEKQWHLLEKENFEMQNFIVSKDFQKELLLLKNNVRQLRLEINNML